MQSNELLPSIQDTFQQINEMDCICESHYIQTTLDSKVMFISFFLFFIVILILF